LGHRTGPPAKNVNETEQIFTKIHLFFGIMSQTMPKRSAGLLMYRRQNELEVFLVHPGGPFWAKKDLGAWSIPKGEYAGDEEPLAAARREFQEETGFSATGEFIELGELKQPGGKIVSVWAFEGDCDARDLRSNTFTMEWPPRSERKMVFPEVDRGSWYSIEQARRYLLLSQRVFLDRLLQKMPTG
jgi:predicted NUDIX family NTP pyrophosphohydrolase